MGVGNKNKGVIMVNSVSFEVFLQTLQDTNRTLDFYVDWQKCLKNRDEIAISLNHLNFLLGKTRQEIELGIVKLFASYPKAFEALPVLIAKRELNEPVLNAENQKCLFRDYLTNPESIFHFFLESHLIEIFENRSIKDLNDFVFGVEVGMDTHARKNRSGNLMEKLLADIFRNNGIDFREQVEAKDLGCEKNFFGSDTKCFDFSIQDKNITYLLECNFYTSGGSKLNETARSYRELSEKISQLENYHFVWITDGKGWLDAKTKIEEAYKKVEIYNLNHIHLFIQKIKK